MTFNELLSAMRFAKPIYPSYEPITEGKDDSDELIERLRAAPKNMHKEWTNIDLISILLSSNKNMSKEIPCKHCGKN